MRIGQKLAAIFREMVDDEIVGGATDQLSVGVAASIAEALDDLAHRDGLFDRRNCLNDAGVVSSGQAIFDDKGSLRTATRIASGLDAFHNDVAGTQFLDLPLSLFADTFAQCHQPNDRRHANQNSEHGQRRSQGMHSERLEAK